MVLFVQGTRVFEVLMEVPCAIVMHLESVCVSRSEKVLTPEACMYYAYSFDVEICAVYLEYSA